MNITLKQLRPCVGDEPIILETIYGTRLYNKSDEIPELLDNLVLDWIGTIGMTLHIKLVQKR